MITVFTQAYACDEIGNGWRGWPWRGWWALPIATDHLSGSRAIDIVILRKWASCLSRFAAQFAMTGIFSAIMPTTCSANAIAHWQVVEGLAQGRLLSERPHTRPNPTVEVEQFLADGTSVNAVWGFVRRLDFVKLVTVHFFD